MKKNIFTRMLVIVMMLAMVMSVLAGCGGKDDDEDDKKNEPTTQSGDKDTGKKDDGKKDDGKKDEPAEVVKTDAELIIGKWETNIDLEDAFAQALTESEGGEMFKDIDFSGISMRMTAEFKDDNTLALQMDKDSAQAAMDQFVDRIVEAMPEIMRKAIAEQAGVDISEVTDDVLEQALTSMGLSSWEDFGDMMRQSMDVDSLFKQSEFSGSYMIKDGKLYSDRNGEATEDSEAMRYELNGDKLVLHPEDTSDDMPDFMKNLTFQRMG